MYSRSGRKHRAITWQSVWGKIRTEFVENSGEAGATARASA